MYNFASKDIDLHVIGVNARKTTTIKCSAMQVIMNGVQAPAPFRHWLAVPEPGQMWFEDAERW